MVILAQAAAMPAVSSSAPPMTCRPQWGAEAFAVRAAPEVNLVRRLIGLAPGRHPHGSMTTLIAPAERSAATRNASRAPSIG